MSIPTLNEYQSGQEFTEEEINDFIYECVREQMIEDVKDMVNRLYTYG